MGGRSDACRLVAARDLARQPGAQKHADAQRSDESEQQHGAAAEDRRPEQVGAPVVAVNAALDGRVDDECHSTDETGTDDATRGVAVNHVRPCITTGSGAGVECRRAQAETPAARITAPSRKTRANSSTRVRTRDVRWTSAWTMSQTSSESGFSPGKARSSSGVASPTKQGR